MFPATKYFVSSKDYHEISKSFRTRFIIEGKLLPYFGKLKVCDIDTIKIRKWQNELISYQDENGVSSVVFTDSCPKRSAICNGVKPSSISILAWLCRRSWRNPLQRWSFPIWDYLSARGARPGCDRAGIIFFACVPSKIFWSFLLLREIVMRLIFEYIPYIPRKENLVEIPSLICS